MSVKIVFRLFGPVQDRIPANPVTIERPGKVIPGKCSRCNGTGRIWSPTTQSVAYMNACYGDLNDNWLYANCPHC